MQEFVGNGGVCDRDAKAQGTRVHRDDPIGARVARCIGTPNELVHWRGRERGSRQAVGDRRSSGAQGGEHQPPPVEVAVSGRAEKERQELKGCEGKLETEGERSSAAWAYGVFSVTTERVRVTLVVQSSYPVSLTPLII